MLVGLMGGGKAMKEMLDKNFEGFAQNTVIVWAQQTTKPYKGFRKGRWWSMDYKDVERLKQRVPELENVVRCTTDATSTIWISVSTVRCAS